MVEGKLNPAYIKFHSYIEYVYIEFLNNFISKHKTLMKLNAKQIETK